MRNRKRQPSLDEHLNSILKQINLFIRPSGSNTVHTARTVKHEDYIHRITSRKFTIVDDKRKILVCSIAVVGNSIMIYIGRTNCYGKVPSCSYWQVDAFYIIHIVGWISNIANIGCN
ncbi:hypothetical protein ES703_111121 [subsurface metagenome]